MKRLSQTDGSAESFVIFYVSQAELKRFTALKCSSGKKQTELVYFVNV